MITIFKKKKKLNKAIKFKSDKNTRPKGCSQNAGYIK